MSAEAFDAIGPAEDVELVKRIASKLRSLVADITQVKDVLNVLAQWAGNQGYVESSLSERVFLGPNAVVKIHTPFGSYRDVPEEWRPTQAVTWEGIEVLVGLQQVLKPTNTNAPYLHASANVDQSSSSVRRQVIVQPRYYTLTNAKDLDLITVSSDSLRHVIRDAWLGGRLRGCDLHHSNWGLRADGGPVLFDY